MDVLEKEAARLEALYSLDVLDTENEPEFDELVALAAAICGTPISTMSLIDEHRQWLKAVIGLDMKEGLRNMAFCEHAIQQEGMFIVEDATLDSRFAAYACVTDSPGIRFYAGMPIHSPDGYALGTLCVVDWQPRRLAPAQRAALEVLARQVSSRLELRLRRKQLQEALAETERARLEHFASEDRFRTFMDSGPFLSFMKDQDGGLLFYNKLFAERFGISREAWLNRSDFELWPRDEASAVRQTDAMVLEKGVLQVHRVVTRDAAGKRTEWCSYRFPCRNADGTVLLGGMAMDITEETRREQELKLAQSELNAANTRLLELSLTDALTGLGNRRVFEERLASAIMASTRGHKLSLVMMDVDHFKLRNDRYGHQNGDEVLRRLGSLLRRVVRGTDTVVRYGGEEFAVLMPGSSAEDAFELARRIMKAVHTEEWAETSVTMSFGVAERSGEMAGRHLIAAADAALYTAKASGRDRIVRADGGA